MEGTPGPPMPRPPRCVLDTTPPQTPSAAATTNSAAQRHLGRRAARNRSKSPIAGKTYVLGTDGALSSDGKGNWKLALTELLRFRQL